MTTVTTKLVVISTTKAQRSVCLNTAAPTGDVTNLIVAKASVLPGEVKIVESNTLLCANFTQPTLIRLQVPSNPEIQMMVSGNLVLPIKSTLIVDRSADTVDTVDFSYVVA